MPCSVCSDGLGQGTTTHREREPYLADCPEGAHRPFRTGALHNVQLDVRMNIEHRYSTDTL